jgi:hypothetical protein
MPRRPFASVILIAVLVHVGFASRAFAAALRPGDIVIATQSSGDLYVIDPKSGATSLLSSGGRLFNPSHVLIDEQGQILVAERSGMTPGIVRTDPATAQQELLASGLYLNYPVALTLDRSGDLIVGNHTFDAQTPGSLVHVDLPGGARTRLPVELEGVASVQDVEVDAAGDIIVLDSGYPAGNSEILRVNPRTGAKTLIASGGHLYLPSDLLVHPSGDLLVANAVRDDFFSELLRIDPRTGAQKVLLTLPNSGFIALEDEDHVLYANFIGGSAAIIRANLVTGATEIVTRTQFNNNIVGIAAYVPVPEPSTSLAVGVSAACLAAARRRRQPLHSGHTSS